MSKKIGNLGEGGQGISEGHKGSGETVKGMFESVRDELDGIKVAAITSPDASDLPTAITLLNEIKTKINAAAATEKQFEK